MSALPKAPVFVVGSLLASQIAAAQTYTVVDTGQTTYFDDAGYISAPAPGSCPVP